MNLLATVNACLFNVLGCRLVSVVAVEYFVHEYRVKTIQGPCIALSFITDESDLN